MGKFIELPAPLHHGMARGSSIPLTIPAVRVRARPQAWVDTPQLIYSQWNEAAGGIEEPLGYLPEDFKICLIGAGICNLIMAFNLRKAGADVTIIEASGEVGGRLRSTVTADGVNVAEMGAMRFPPSEDLLYYYAEAFGFTFMADFPDPGKVPTVVSYQGEAHRWITQKEAPMGFDKVDRAWKSFINEGLRKQGHTILESSRQMTEWLQSPNPFVRVRATSAWQRYLDEFGNHSFYTGLQRIFGPQHDWDVPGGEAWDDDDFERFGLLGIGSGGFGPVFPVGFNSVFRLVVNGLETDQASFAKISGGKLRPAGIQELALEIWNKATAMGVKTHLNTTGKVIGCSRDTCGEPFVTVQETVDKTESTRHVNYDFVFVGTTSRAMDLSVSLTDHQPNGDRLLSPKICTGINHLHMTSSSKVFIRTKKFWENKEPNFTRVILSDTKSPQTYTLDYGHEEYGMVLISYTWEDLSSQMMAVQDSATLLEVLKRQIAIVMRKTEHPDYADHLIPVTPDDIYVIHWQLDPHAYGAFSLPLPGQDRYVAAMFYDFEKLSRNIESRVLIGSDCTSWLGGWIDGGLQPVHNNLAALFKRFGSLAESAAHLAPVNILDSNLYRY